MSCAFSAGGRRPLPHWIAWAAVCALGCADQTAAIGWNPVPSDTPGASCSDGLRNGAETDVDCGGECLARCGLGSQCVFDFDCASDACVDDVCSPSEPVLGTAGSGASGGSSGTAGSGGAGGTAGSAASGGTTAPGSAGSMGNGGTTFAGSGGEGAGAVPAAGGTGGESVTEGGSPGAGDYGAGGIGDTDQPPIGTCPGCARLWVSFDDKNDGADFAISLPNPVDFSAAKLEFRVYRGMGMGIILTGYVQRGMDYEPLVQREGLSLDDARGWTVFVWDVARETGTFDKSAVERVGLRFSVHPTESWSTPAMVYVDSITVTGADAGPWLFESLATIVPEPATSAPPNVMWLDRASSPKPGSSLEWFNRE